MQLQPEDHLTMGKGGWALPPPDTGVCAQTLMTICERVAYLKGLAEGLGLDAEKSREDKLISVMIDILEDIGMSLEDLEEGSRALAETVDAVSDDLEDLENDVYGIDGFDPLALEGYDEDEEDEEDDSSTAPIYIYGQRVDEEEDADGEEEPVPPQDPDGDWFAVTCPHCEDEITITTADLSRGWVRCPGCKTKFKLDADIRDDSGDESPEE